MILAYSISTALSVVPRISFWGSYQRLQGTYTTFSYITIFFMVLSTLRRREQLSRLINTIIITSLPIAIYGILQHYQRDPLPWGGDVTARVAANMGNAIFVAAYLIMAIFLTIERLIRSFSILMDERKAPSPTPCSPARTWLFWWRRCWPSSSPRAAARGWDCWPASTSSS